MNTAVPDIFRVIFIWLALSLPASRSNAVHTLPLGKALEKGRLALFYGPGVAAGTHVRGVGIESGAEYRYLLSSDSRTLGQLIMGADASLSGLLGHYGIPGKSALARIAYCLGYTTGKQAGRRPDAGKYGFRYRYILYLATDGTSQFSGSVEITLNFSDRRLRLIYENDWYGLQFRDQYRTAAAEVNWQWLWRGAFTGVLAGFKLWTGQTENFPTFQTKIFPVPGAHGSAWSHGIAYVGGLWGPLRLSLGWDSESVRDFIQNNYHRLRGIGEILPLSRRDKLYVQLEFTRSSFLF